MKNICCYDVKKFIFDKLSDWIRRDTPYFSVFNPSAGKYGPEKTPYLDTFHAVYVFIGYIMFWTFHEIQTIV